MAETSLIPAARAAADCPKRMVFGPCGGVHAEGTCEVRDVVCPFVAESTTYRPVRVIRSRQHDESTLSVPFVVGDFRTGSPDMKSVEHAVGAYAGTVDALLIGEHQDRPDLPSILVAQAMLSEGISPWVTISCRDRNRAVIEADLHGYSEIGVFAVHCVTGDARAPYVRPEVTQVFDLDAVRLTQLAAGLGLRSSVAETPTAPPVDQRAARVVTKEYAGAEFCFVNHCGGPTAVAKFVGDAVAAGASLGFVACVPLFANTAGVEALAALPGVVLDQEQVRAVRGAKDPVQAGIAAAIAAGRAMLAIPGVVGINLSGPAATQDQTLRMEVMTSVAAGVRA